MKFPLKWLQEYVKIDMPVSELVKLLPSIGFEVEEIITECEDISGVVVGKITALNKHPNADKLQICDIDIGGGKNNVIVTGARNIAVGNLVPVALPGAKLVGGMSIAVADLRGVTSYGMLCSGQELGIGAEVCPNAAVDGIWILNEGKVGEDIKKVFGFDDVTLDISIPSNRGDCYSIYGMAREIAAATSKKLKPLDLDFVATPSSLEAVPVSIEYNECTRYMGATADNIRIEESPSVIRHRLRQSGMRPINNIVDITNYVLLEVGQPLHAFDSKLLNGGIVVRQAFDKEKLRALDEVDYTLPKGSMVIADKSKGLAIAGVMGGEYSGITSNTSQIFIESARFNKGNIRATSRALGLRSASSARFEKGLDFLSPEVGLKRALVLVSKLKAGRVIGNIVDVKPSVLSITILPQNKIIKTSVKDIAGILGIDIKKTVIVKTLNSLGIATKSEGSKLVCTIPLYREDIDNFTDLAEEIIRLIGYDKITPTFMQSLSVTQGGKTEYAMFCDRLKDMMCAGGLYEAFNYSFVKAGRASALGITDKTLLSEIKINSPLSEDYAVMRTQTISGMLESVSLNQKRGNAIVRLFELGRVYLPKSVPVKELPVERDKLTIVISGGANIFEEIKGIVDDIMRFCGVADYKLNYSKQPFLHGGISADITVNDICLGYFGKIHPMTSETFEVSDCFVACFDTNTLFEKYQSKSVRFAPLPKYPGISRDIAVIVGENVLAGDVVEAIKQSAGELLERVKLFDVYKGSQVEAGNKSMAYSLFFRDSTRTLIDKDADSAVAGILEKLSKDFGAKLR